MKFNVNYKEGDVYNDKVVTKISVTRRMNPRRDDRFGHYVYWKNYKKNIENRCNFSSFGLNNHRYNNVVRGVNDIATVAPWMVPWFKDKNVPYTHTVYSKHKVDWICPYCGAYIKNREIANFYIYKKVVCQNCSDGISYGERFLSNLLTSLHIDFEPQQSFGWSDGRFYDFYIPSLNMIIETHGKQHYTNTWSAYIDSKSKISIQDNDVYKKELAIKNGINNYIIIDCMQSSGDYIKNSILSSELVNFFDLFNVNWKEIEINSLKSVFINVVEFLNNGGSRKDAASIFGVSEYTIYRYIKRAGNIGLLNKSVDYFINHNNRACGRKTNDWLSNREIMVGCLYVNKYKALDIAKILDIQLSTVKYYIHSIYKKLHLSSKKELVSLYNSDIKLNRIFNEYFNYINVCHERSETVAINSIHL